MNFLELPSPLWVLGTGTGVGKTYVASRIARAWAEAGPVEYRKPFQTGVGSDEDAEADAAVLRGPGILASSGVILRQPLSPMAAAEQEGRVLDLESLAKWTITPPQKGTRLLLEGVGGVLVPLAPHVHFLDWATKLKSPAVVVARGGLGTLNHTLLTCEALMTRGWTISAVILNPGVDGSANAVAANAEILRRFLPVPVGILE
jgi:dethiobiotin synthase